MRGNAINKQELFKRLAEGRTAGITVVTPNKRLARVLKAEFDAHQAGRGVPVWEEADILPLSSFVETCYDDALYAEGGEKLPRRLSASQARELWEEAVRASQWNAALLDVPRTAADAMDSWKLAQAWRIAGALEKFEGTEDTRAFAEWARAYMRRLKKDGYTDLPLLFDVSFKTNTKLLVAYAFDVVSAQEKDLFARFESVSCSPEKKQSNAKKISFASPREELEAAAAWARARLEEGRRRIGVVVPGLKVRRREVDRVFARAMGSPLPFDLSVGEPLADFPLAAFALNLLQFAHRDKPFEEVSRLIRSPFLGGAEKEMAARALLDAKLRRRADSEISLPKLIGMIGDEPGLRPILESVFGKAKESAGNSLSAPAWAQHFSDLLAAANPGGRALDSVEYQTRAKFNEMLAEFSRLGVVSSKMSFEGAMGRLRRLCAETRFQPEGTRAPIQVLEILESPGLEFDALWVSGLTDDIWPQHAHPDPFLPVLFQRKAGIPQASAEASLALDRRRTEGWMGAADEVVFSWARREKDRDLSPSPFIAQVPERTVEMPMFASYRDMIFMQGKTETFTDERALPVTSTTVKGGTRVLADQAACPFRAYARHRLAAEALEAPEPGLDALQRGQLLHSLMAGIWRLVKSSSGLSSDLAPLIEKSAAAAVADLGLEGRFAELEKQRLFRLAVEWLDVERQRQPFEVLHTEEKRTLEIGGLTLSGRIDRMDALGGGGHALIDYKTGRATKSSWLGDRPDEPQLPLYAISAKEDVTAVAFATLRVGEMKFSGFSAREKELPGVMAARSWSGLVATWKRDLEKLADGFATGDARVDPKKGFATCRNCDLQPLCRVYERIGALEEEGEGD